MQNTAIISDSVYMEPIESFNFDSKWFIAFKNYMDVKPVTLKGYITCIKHFANWIEEKSIVNPARNDILSYKKDLADSNLAIGTQAQYLRAVKHFFRWTASEGLYPNIAENIKVAKVRQDIHKKDALKRSDVIAIEKNIDRSTEQGKRLYAMYLLAITCGLRTVEISRANIEDVKEQGERTYLYVQGKGHDDKDQPVLLIPEVMEALKEYLDARTDKKNGKSPLFVSTSNRSKGKRIATTTISTIFKKMFADAGYKSDRITAHSLRHTSGTGVYKATGNIYLAQKHQRHSDPATTEIYVHAEERENRNTEQQVYDYYFKDENKVKEEHEALNLLSSLNESKLEQTIEFMKSIN